VPPLAAVAASAAGTTRLRNAARLRLKESDRLKTVSAAINAVGGSASLRAMTSSLLEATLVAAPSTRQTTIASP
jgi:5-enolpyruvylshikimate-3-phosphate synthase